MKTNKHWYRYETYEGAGYFQLEDGVLMGCPMAADGTREDAPVPIESFDYTGDEYRQLWEIEQDLELKE